MTLFVFNLSINSIMLYLVGRNKVNQNEMSKLSFHFIVFTYYTSKS